MHTGDDVYEVYALRYASREGRKSRAFYGFHRYGEPDQPYRTDYYFWLARNAHRTVLIDTGYNTVRAADKNRFLDNDPNDNPLDVLALLDVHPENVDHVVITHMHYDHTGNLDQFPNATFSMAHAEFEFWTGPYGDREPITRAVDRDELDIVTKLHQNDRLHFVDDSVEVYPGLRATTLGGHTPGQLVVEISGGVRTVVLASDASHFYEEFQADRPFELFCDIEGMYRGYELFREFDAKPDTAVVPGHDPDVMRRFSTVVDDRVVDLLAPLA